MKKNLLRSWLLAQLHSNANIESATEKVFLEDNNLDDILNEIVPASDFAKELASCADLKDLVEKDEIMRTNDSVVDFLAEYSDRISHRLRDVFMIVSPKNWPLELLELVANCQYRCDLYDQCNWRKDRASCLTAFKDFMKGSIQDSGCSDELYRTLFVIFMPAFKLFSLWDHLGLNFFMDGPSPELVRGVIKMARKGVYLDEFETFIPD